MLALVASFHPVVEIVVGDSAQRFVIETGETQSFTQIFLEIMNGFEFFGLGGLAPAGGSHEEFLEAAIGEAADLGAHDYTRPFDNYRGAVLAGANYTGNTIALDAGAG